MGFFDIPAPLFGFLDSYLEAILPPLGRLLVWAVAAGVLSMATYRLFSAQENISRIKSAAAAARNALARYDGEFEGLWPLIRASLALSSKHMGVTLWPALVASLPALFIMAWVSNSFGYHFPSPGTPTDIRVVPAQAEIAWNTENADMIGDATWRIDWPTPVAAIELTDISAKIIAEFPLSAPVPVVHKWQWWNAIIGNPAGYLPDAIEIERIEIALPNTEYLNFGPAWLRSWEPSFLIVLVLCSLAVKFAFRIE
jgi:hypothetical protein